MATLPDPARSEAVLVGAHAYGTLPDLPAVARNLDGLRGVLTDPAVWGLHGERCTVLAQPSSAQQVLDTVKEAAARATDTLFVYYGGHGLIDPHTDELYLALPDSVHDREYTALRYEYLRRAVLDAAAGVRRTVVVLDCCYSGRALIGRMSASDEIADRAAVEGTCLLTASAETRAALSPPGETYTAFTGELITALGEGIPGAPDLIDMNTLYRHLHRTLAAKSRPLPQQRNRNTGGLIALARNRAVAAAVAAPVPAPVPPIPTHRPEAAAPPHRDRKPSRGQVVGAAAAALVVIGGTFFAVTQLGGDDDKGNAEAKGSGNATGPSVPPSDTSLGDIVVAGKPVTGSTKSVRTYADGKLYAPVTGYRSRAFGATGLESIYRNALDNGSSKVITTIDPAVQKAAYEALGDAKGAAIAIDPSNGDILALVSTPSYDPATFSGSTSADGKAWQKLTGDKKNDPMLNRATREAYPPGSTFELVVAAAALEEGLYATVDEATAGPNPYTLPGTTTSVSNKSAPGSCKNASLRVALRYSCDNVFAKAAVDLGWAKVKKMADKFGFNDDDREMPIRVGTSVFPSGPTQAETALSGVGGFEVTATPFQMAMVSAVLANDGKLAPPHMVSKVTGSAGNVQHPYLPDTKRVVSQRTAAELRGAMTAAVTGGTSTAARVGGADVGATTALAQSGSGRIDWCTAYAQPGSGGRQVAITVVVEGESGGTEGGAATSVAKRAMQAAIAHR
ncbi:caspase, EACC1-associated type [Streptomyces sp. RTd22]|uniref:caspase, EACC1-associated type n=1 Tax=Streptomyces sp. RTd22 TaxID=1841249 RepID=UPI000AC80C5C|nr:penicillin-binding transpeptidase domain-containing protein [Streptomyces sp. RTd22]